ncbi:MAG: carboxypeptidase regulatory-like domain-containing protein, partial [Deltaproteobacteria bacterium]
AGAARLTYFDESARDLKYATQQPGASWVLQTVDSLGDVGRYTSIAIDSLGHAHVSYYDTTNSNLKYALIAAPE